MDSDVAPAPLRPAADRDDKIFSNLQKWIPAMTTIFIDRKDDTNKPCGGMIKV